MPATHYDTLKVARDAPLEVIRAAYRVLSQKYHPDRNPDNVAAAHSMAVLNAAYDVLSDADKKRQYDELIESIESETVFEELGTPRPSRAWPRHKGAIHAMEETRLGRLFGDWKLYAGLLLLGGVGLLVWAAAPALHRREVEIPQPSTATSPYVFEDPTLPRATPAPGTSKTRPSAPDEEAAPRLATPPAPTNSANPPAASARSKQTPAAASPARETQADKKPPTSPAKSAITATPTNLKRKPSPAVDFGGGVVEGHYTRPALAPSGMAWPASSDYVGGYHQLNTDGMSQVIVDNSQNDFDAFVKVVYLGEGEPETARAIFLSARDRFTVVNLRAGTYDLRYQNLDSGTLLRSGVFALEESAIAGGTRHSTVSMTLHYAADDGTNTYLLSERDF